MDPNDFGAQIAAAGFLGVVIVVLVWLLGFIFSAWVMSIWIRLIIVFMRKALDREYTRMRGEIQLPAIRTTRQAGPRDW